MANSTRGPAVRFTVGVVIVLLVAGVFLRRVVPSQQRGPRKTTPAASAKPAKLPAQLVDVGPRLVSNQTSTPLLVMGRGLKTGDKLVLGEPANLEVALADADGDRGWTRLPAIDLPAGKSEADIAVTLKPADGSPAAGQVRITVANDLHFPDPVGLALAGGQLCAISTTTDEMRCGTEGFKADAATKKVALGDGPTAIASNGKAFIVGHEYTPELWVIDPANLNAPRKLAGPRSVTGLVVEGDTAYVAEHLHNQLWAIGLTDGKVRWKADVDPGPYHVAVAGDQIAVGSHQTGEVQLVNKADGKLTATLAPGPGMPILSGHTAKFSKYIDGGLPVRDLAYSKKLKLLFAAGSGPDIGPNPERMEVADNGGILVIDPVKRQVLYHLGFGAGVTEALAIDDQHGLLYATDVALGLVRVVSLKALAGFSKALPKGEPEALTAVLATTPIPPPAGFPSILPAEQLGVKGRAGPELHSGPKAISAGNDGRLYTLNRLSGTLARFETTGRGGLSAPAQIPLFEPLTQPQRRLGEVLYYADVGRTNMSCDSCHVDGHVGGLLFSKTRPIRLYRATSVRGSRETPPYFIPSSERSLATTASFVGTRNRYHNPEMSPPEIAALALFSSEIPTPPNPYVQDDGALPPELALPDGLLGHPKAGVGLFFGKAACQTCHPGPLFTTDQDVTTRARYMNVGTPPHFPLRSEMQDPVAADFPAQSLNGIWDLFPLTTTGIAGLALGTGADDGRLVVATRFPLRAVVEYRGTHAHGNLAALSKEEENDLLAFLMTL